MNTSRRGNAAELRVAAYLQRRGWLVASRRHIGGAGDLLAVKPGYPPRLIEVKASKKPWENFRPADRSDLLTLAQQFEAEAFLALAPGLQVSFVPSKDWPGGG